MVQGAGQTVRNLTMVGGHNEKQNIQIIEIIIETLQEMLADDDPRKALVSKDLITYVADRKGHDRRYAIAPDKIKKEIGWYPETMFKEGIKKTIAWYFEHEDWMERVTSGDYQKYYNEMYKARENSGLPGGKCRTDRRKQGFVYQNGDGARHRSPFWRIWAGAHGSRTKPPERSCKAKNVFHTGE